MANLRCLEGCSFFEDSGMLTDDTQVLILSLFLWKSSEEVLVW